MVCYCRLPCVPSSVRGIANLLRRMPCELAEQISPWWHQTSQVTVQIRTDSGTESFTGPEVTRTATLVTLDQCRPAYDSFPEICTTTPLDDISAAGAPLLIASAGLRSLLYLTWLRGFLATGDAVDRALWKAGGVGFGIMFVALMVAVATLFVTAAALLGQTHKLKPQFMTTKGVRIVFVGWTRGLQQWRLTLLGAPTEHRVLPCAVLPALSVWVCSLCRRHQ